MGYREIFDLISNRFRAQGIHGKVKRKAFAPYLSLPLLYPEIHTHRGTMLFYSRKNQAQKS